MTAPRIRAALRRIWQWIRRYPWTAGNITQTRGEEARDGTDHEGRKASADRRNEESRHD